MKPWQQLFGAIPRFGHPFALGVALASLPSLPAQAQSETPVQSPGVYYSWRALDTTTEQCLERSQQALTAEQIGEIQQVDNSVAGRTTDTTVVFVCLPNAENIESTTVMVIVAGQDDQTALDLRSALQAAF